MKKRYFVISAVGLVAAAVTAAGIWTFPLWHTAYYLYHLSKAKSLDCQMNASLEEEALPESARKLLKAVSWALGMEDSAILEWKATGGVSEGRGYLDIYCDAQEQPVTQIYFEKGNALVNVKMLYEMLQDNFKQEHPLMGTMFPDWQYGTYLSLDQIQEIFQIDLKKIFQENRTAELSSQSFWKIALALQGMERKKTEHESWQFGTMYKNYKIVFESGKEKQEPYLHVWGTRGQQQVLKEISARLSPGQEEDIVIPDSLMKQEEVVQFQKIWSAASYLIEGRK